MRRGGVHVVNTYTSHAPILWFYHEIVWTENTEKEQYSLVILHLFESGQRCQFYADDL